MPVSNPFRLRPEEIEDLLAQERPWLPELSSAATSSVSGQFVLANTEALMHHISAIPATGYTAYRRFRLDGDRRQYEGPYFLKREYLSAAVLRCFLGQDSLKDIIQDIIWNICEETNWVLPAHEERPIDLFAAETALLLAEAQALLGSRLDAEVRHRIRHEVDRRVFEPYLRYHQSLGWYKGGNNWNGVCNSSVAAAFLWLEPDPSRRAQGLAVALDGLRVFLETAFEKDGSSTEGVAYWHYGLMNFVVLAEMLHARSAGAIDLLGSDRMRRIAAYPARMQLAGPTFASFSDCHEVVAFNPGIITRLAARTREQSLLNLLAKPAAPAHDWRLTMMLRNLLWWDGSQPDATALMDAYLPDAGTARLTAMTPGGIPVVVAIKAGHNGENHNQNDVGSFIVNADGENLLTDPGPGLYSRQYFSTQRYENIFANSYGHSVPRIGGRLQGTGIEYAGRMLSVSTLQSTKTVAISFAHAYPVNELRSARRVMQVATTGEHAGAVWLQDEFEFTQHAAAVEEAFVTWCEVECAGPSATIHGEKHDCRMTIESPAELQFQLEPLTEQSHANAMDRVLKRITAALPSASTSQVRIRIELIE